MAHVLLIKDDKLNTIIFTKLLELRGNFRVTHSEDPEPILKLCHEDSIDLIVMDISLNKSYYQGRFIDGVEITRIIKNNTDIKHIPVILTTAHAMAGDKERYLTDSGAEAYVTKPVTDHEGFIELVQSTIIKK